jgi:hypothetical protein
MMKSDLIPCCSRCRHCSLMMLFHAHFFYKKLGPKTAELTIAKAEKAELLSLFSTLLEVLLLSNMSTPHFLHMGYDDSLFSNLQLCSLYSSIEYKLV